MKKPHLIPTRAAFSLIELVVVVAIIALIATFTVPAATTILRGSAMTQASQMLTDQISLARQIALSKNRAVEVRIYKYADPEAPGESAKDVTTGKLRAIQLFEVVESGAAVPIDKAQRFPITVVMNPAKLSTLVSDTTQKEQTPTTKDPELPRGVARFYRYYSFRFQPDGATNLPTKSTSDTNGAWTITIHNITDNVTGTTLPPNFFTIQIDPVSGSTKGFRPTAG